MARTDRLLRKASRGDGDALELTIHRLSRDLYPYFLAMLGDEGCASRALGDTSAEIASDLRETRVTDDPSGRIWEVARAVAYHHARTHRAFPNGSPWTHPAVLELGDETREVLVLREVLGWDRLRIARILGTSPEAVSDLLLGARQALSADDRWVASVASEPVDGDILGLGSGVGRRLERRARRFIPWRTRIRTFVHTIRTFWPFIRPHWKGLLPAGIAVVAGSIVSLARPWPLKFLFDDVLKVNAGGPTEESAVLILPVVGALIGIAAFAGLLSYVKTYFLQATSQRIAFKMRSALFEHIQRLSLLFHDRQRTGDLITRLTSDVGKVQSLIAEDLLIDGTSAVIQMTGMLGLMLFLNWQLGAVSLLLIPLVFLPLIRFGRRIKAEEIVVRQKEGDIASLATEAISSIRVVKAFGRERFESERFDRHSNEALEANVRVSRLGAAFGWATGMGAAVSLAAIVGVGSYQVVLGALSVGTLVVFIQYLRDFQSPLTTLSKLSVKTARATVRAERILEVLGERPAAVERPDAREAPPFRGEIRFEGVTFGYEPDRLVLRDVDLVIPAGGSAAVVGATGAGKSTLASLLLRLYEPQEGRITIDGHDVRDLKLDSVVGQIAVVLQDSILFGATVRENIAYGRPGATDEEIREASRIALCEEFIEELPLGYETLVGERGATLSGGQRQRIAIARAIIRDAPILVLDEPTTALDAESEATVLLALERLMEGRTSLLISHKLVAARRADRIHLIADARIAEQGTHDELVALGGDYGRAFALQQGDLDAVETA